MLPNPLHYEITITLACIPIVIWAIARYQSRSNTYPPGPRGLPIIGAAFLVPKEKEWVTYAEWKKRYGNIVGFRVFRNNIVILNTPQLANQLLNKRSRIYSHRGQIPMLELMNFSWNVGLMHAGSRHTLSRRVFLRGLSSTTIVNYRSQQQKYVRTMLNDLLTSPTNFVWHLRRLNVSLNLELFFGLETTTQCQHEEFVRLNESIIDISSLAGSPGAYLINIFPTLKHWPASFPGGGFHNVGKAGKNLADRVIEMASQLQRDLINKRIPSLYSHINDTDMNDGETSIAVAAAAATSYAAGIETTTSTLLTFVLAMVLFQEVQHDAQAVMDPILNGRMPTFEDRDANRFPIVDAIIQECYRWAPPGPFGLPHHAREDDTIDGYTIPKGTIVFSNIWSIFHDENIYPRPMEFIPKRFLVEPREPDPRDHVFGYGKRACPGRNLAETTLWIAIASILASLKISPATDSSGHPIIPDIEYTSGVMSRPKDFICNIGPRHNAL